MRLGERSAGAERRETLAEAKQAGLGLALDGADLIVANFGQLAPAAAAHWRSRLRMEKAALVDSLRGKDNPSAVILRQLGVKVVYLTSHAVAEADRFSPRRRIERPAFSGLTSRPWRR